MTADGPKVGVDIGGTFTDVALEQGGPLFSAKVLTTHSAPELGIFDGLFQVLAKAGVALGDLGCIVHGTTLATNALIERRGAYTALVTTQGFRDVIEMRTENRFELYDLNITLPRPLIPRKDRLVVNERIDAKGGVLKPLDEAVLAAVCDTVLARGYRSVAVGLMHSYANPGHEQRIRAALLARDPTLSVSLSSEVSPQMREFQRFNTVCANAYIKPLMASYLKRLVETLRQHGGLCPVLMIHSGGGVIALDSAAEFPVRLLESGPAGGAIFAADVARRYGLDRVLSFDMGGTTAKICLVNGQVPKTAKTFEVARSYRFKKGSGMPVSIPVIEMVEIGAGGGSLAAVDAMGQIRIGPHSAGSEPGPACYGRGGTGPTVTDADLLLGRLEPDGFAGGTMKLLPDAARGAVSEAVAGPLVVDVDTAAFGICEMVDETMANAARMHAVESGCDLNEYTMVAFGGAAPLHACRLCEKLGIRSLLIPPGAGVGSAIGFLRAPVSFEAVRSAYVRLSRFDPALVNATLAELEVEATGFVRAAAPDGAIDLQCTAHVRYVGQGWEIPVPVALRTYAGADAPALMSAFETSYRSLFGRSINGLGAEILSWSLRATVPVPLPDPVQRVEATQDAPRGATRPLHDAQSGRFTPSVVVQRATLRPGMRVRGPAVIPEPETTIIVSPAFEAIMQPDGSVLLQQVSTPEEAQPA